MNFAKMGFPLAPERERAQQMRQKRGVSLFQRKTKGQQLKGKIDSALFRTFFTLSHPFFTLFPHDLFLKIKAFLKRAKENNKKKTKPFCMLAVARLSSSDEGFFFYISFTSKTHKCIFESSSPLRSSETHFCEFSFLGGFLLHGWT